MQAIACKLFCFLKIVNVSKSRKYFINGSLLRIGGNYGIAGGLSKII